MHIFLETHLSLSSSLSSALIRQQLTVQMEHERALLDVISKVNTSLETVTKFALTIRDGLLQLDQTMKEIRQGLDEILNMSNTPTITVKKKYAGKKRKTHASDSTVTDNEPTTKYTQKKNTQKKNTQKKNCPATKNTTSLMSSGSGLNVFEIAALGYVRNQCSLDKTIVCMGSRNIFDDVLDIELTARILASLDTKNTRVENAIVMDNVLDCYMAILSKRKEKNTDVMFVNTSIIPYLQSKGESYYEDSDIATIEQFEAIATAGVNFRRRNMIFLPLQRSDGHWYVGVLNKNKKEFQILDSNRRRESSGTYNNQTWMIRQGILRCMGTTYAGNAPDVPEEDIVDWPISIISNIPRQTDLHSCGIFALKCMEFWNGVGLEPSFSQVEIDIWRKKMVAEFLFSDLNSIVEVRNEIIVSTISGLRKMINEA